MDKERDFWDKEGIRKGVLGIRKECYSPEMWEN